MRIKASKDRRHVEVWFDYDPYIVGQVKNIPGATWRSQRSGGPCWYFMLEFETLRSLYKKFPDAHFDKRLMSWAKKRAAESDRLRQMTVATSADLKRLPEVLPALHTFVAGRSYQLADIAYMAEARHPINANQPSLGKTVEAIAAIFEAGLEHGPHLVAAPVTSLELVWQTELETWQDFPVIVCQGSAQQKERAISQAADLQSSGEPFWLVTNPQTLLHRSWFDICARHVALQETRTAKLRKCSNLHEGCIEHSEPKFPWLHAVPWNSIIFDEFHMTGLSNPESQFRKACKGLTAEKIIPMSGTPMGGRPVRIWAMLNFLYPDEFTSKWRWIEQWLDVQEGDYGMNVGGVREDRDADFGRLIGEYVLRRTKEECLPWLPPKQRIDLWVEMAPKQRKQYQTFAEEAEVRIADMDLTAVGILDEYARLKQLAMAYCTWDDKDRLVPTSNSCKLPTVMELLEERGISGDKNNQWGDEQVVIASQFTRMINMTEKFLKGKGIDCVKITGAVPAIKRRQIQQEFQGEGGPRVLLINTTAGGVSINLDRASTMIILDETWNPDDQEQVEDRIHRGSRIHQVTIYYIRTKNTIEHYIWNITKGKSHTNYTILDMRRLGLRAA